MRGDELRIGRDGSADRLDECRFGNRRDRDERRGMLHAFRIAVGAEDCDATVGVGRGGRVPEGLEAFVGVLSVVQTRGNAVDGDVGRGRKGGG